MKKKCIDLAIEQAGTNICSMVYQDINFKICLSLFGCEVNILPNVHIVQWRFYVMAQDEGGIGLVGYADVHVNLV